MLLEYKSPRGEIRITDDSLYLRGDVGPTALRIVERHWGLHLGYLRVKASSYAAVAFAAGFLLGLIF